MAFLKANRSDFGYYALLREFFAPEGMLACAPTHPKSSLVGNADADINAAQDRGFLTVTYHHNWYHGTQDRMPRLRFHIAHFFNIWADDTPLVEIPGVNRIGVKATADGGVKVENSFFIDVDQPVKITGSPSRGAGRL